MKSAFKECIICNYYYFLDRGFKFQQAVYNGYYNVLIKGIY